MTTETQSVLHKMHFPELPYYLEVYFKINDTTDTVKVEVHSRLHVKRVNELPLGWSIEFMRDRPNEVRGDILGYIISAYDLEPKPAGYW